MRELTGVPELAESTLRANRRRVSQSYTYHLGGRVTYQTDSARTVISISFK